MHRCPDTLLHLEQLYYGARCCGLSRPAGTFRIKVIDVRLLDINARQHALLSHCIVVQESTRGLSCCIPTAVASKYDNHGVGTNIGHAWCLYLFTMFLPGLRRVIRCHTHYSATKYQNRLLYVDPMCYGSGDKTTYQRHMSFS